MSNINRKDKKQKIWPVELLIVCFMLCTGFNTQAVYAADLTSLSATSTSDISLTQTDIENNTEETVSVDDVAHSYQKLASKLKTNENAKEEAKEEYEKEVARKKEQALRQNIIKTALSKRGCPYVWGATGPNQFDCSGLTQWAYKQMGMTIPRVAASQAQYGQKISKSELKIGDLIFYRTDIGSRRISHVGIYIGNGEMVHAPATGYTVRVANIHSAYWKNAYAWACRYV